MARPNDLPIPPRLPVDLLSSPNLRLTEASDLYRLTIQGVFSDADLAEMTLEESHIVHSVFVSADLGRLRMVDCLVEGSDLSGADMQEASFTRVAFKGCRMSGALIAQAHLQNVTFSESKLDGVNSRMCQGDRVLFDHVNLGEASFYATAVNVRMLFRLRSEWHGRVSGGLPGRSISRLASRSHKGRRVPARHRDRQFTGVTSCHPCLFGSRHPSQGVDGTLLTIEWAC